MEEDLFSCLSRPLTASNANRITEPAPTVTGETTDQKTVAYVSSDAMLGIDQTERALTEEIPQIRWTRPKHWKCGHTQKI